MMMTHTPICKRRLNRSLLLRNIVNSTANDREHDPDPDLVVFLFSRGRVHSDELIHQNLKLPLTRKEPCRDVSWWRTNIVLARGIISAFSKR
jgi:hypothetical protein